jgi:hypothetical protein
MIVLDPDKITAPNNLSNGLCKEVVGLLVCTPVILIERDLAGVIMEEGP